MTFLCRGTWDLIIQVIGKLDIPQVVRYGITGIVFSLTYQVIRVARAIIG
jgi:hypothetical protein